MSLPACLHGLGEGPCGPASGQQVALWGGAHRTQGGDKQQSLWAQRRPRALVPAVCEGPPALHLRQLGSRLPGSQHSPARARALRAAEPLTLPVVPGTVPDLAGRGGRASALGSAAHIGACLQPPSTLSLRAGEQRAIPSGTLPLHACESSLLIGSRDKVAGNLTTGGTLRATLLGLVLQMRCGPCPRGLWSLLVHSPCEALTCTVHCARLSCVAVNSSGGVAPHASSHRALCPCSALAARPRADRL